jgi:glutathione S-transferase
LLDGDLAVWDSLAILEYLAERHPDKHLWPADRQPRALARSVSAEMHSGFAALRQACSMEILADDPLEPVSETVETDIRRIIALWRECRSRFGAGGPFLFGEFSAADAMYAPVASRFRTYIPDLGRYGDDGTAAGYVATIFAMPEVAGWIDGAREQVAAQA